MRSHLLAPIALLQGLWVLQRTPLLPSPAGCAGRFGTGLGTPLRVVGVGDSAIAGTGVRELRNSITAVYARLLQERLQRDVSWRVHGSNGATSSFVLQKLVPAAAVADVYLMSVGVNDATHGVRPERYAANLEQIIAQLRQKAPQAALVFGGLPPLDCFPALPWPLCSMLAERARLLQRIACRTATRHDRVYCFRFPPSMPASQFASDGFHPAEYACERWAAGLLDLWPLPPASGSALDDEPWRGVSH